MWHLDIGQLHFFLLFVVHTCSIWTVAQFLPFWHINTTVEFKIFRDHQFFTVGCQAFVSYCIWISCFFFKIILCTYITIFVKALTQFVIYQSTHIIYIIHWWGCMNANTSANCGFAAVSGKILAATFCTSCSFKRMFCNICNPFLG